MEVKPCSKSPRFLKFTLNCKNIVPATCRTKCQALILIINVHLFPVDTTLKSSKILKGHPDYYKKLAEYLKPVEVSGKIWKRCYIASENSYSSYSFHSACNNKGPTVTLVRVGSYVFGGYTDKSWTSKYFRQFQWSVS